MSSPRRPGVGGRRAAVPSPTPDRGPARSGRARRPIGLAGWGSVEGSGARGRARRPWRAHPHHARGVSPVQGRQGTHRSPRVWPRVGLGPAGGECRGRRGDGPPRLPGDRPGRPRGDQGEGGQGGPGAGGRERGRGRAGEPGPGREGGRERAGGKGGERGRGRGAGARGTGTPLGRLTPPWGLRPPWGHRAPPGV